MRILFVVLCLLLTGCSTSLFFVKSELEQKKKGVVFFTVVDQDSSKCFELKKLGDEYPTHKCGYDSFSNAYNFISLKPGIYYLDVVYLKPISAGTIRYYPGPGLIKNSKFKYGAFEVKGGEVLAIGLLNINSKKNTFRFIDNFEKIKRDLEKSACPELVPKLKRGKFFMPGSSVVAQDGKFVLIDKEETEKSSLIKKLCQGGMVNEKFCK